jgi:hypothetical protein
MNKEPTKGIQKESANLPNGLSLESDSGHKGKKKKKKHTALFQEPLGMDLSLKSM